ncbi:MAG: VanZ family protein [Ruminococcus sp.]|uniref:VanZ family protein n=1 Tax=Ruminococcus sp. TaxID=41978 RepID=UPI0025F8230B|nr:VanZ family protein [Ruminococcus sp.]MCR5601451.1 VanZ family protein [Ruminococcus sp.]
MQNKSSKISALQLIFLVLTIAVMVAIFVLSAENAEESSKTSGSMTKVAVKIIDKDYSKRSLYRQHEIWNTASFIVRKLAHFTIYTALGFCASMTAGKRKLISLKSLCVVVFGFLYALSDELHQTMSEGRSCEFRDMMIDTGGAVLGMIFSLIIMYIVMHIINKRKEKA